MNFITFPVNYSVSFNVTGINNDWLTAQYNIDITSLTNDSIPYQV